ncbi:intradiol ring-cleavage dioxygenase [Streptomyces lincolnensis]|uniref:Intradiol ring-cleavage dioxygenase n=1 Tax=Streptomyces lincolnensis TaxID=1915 RepID=A0A1B1MDB7_STRLN|nr:intradiol ring-cleavage dioxygenase [Streptomyces lincolnensis]ANS66571.1 intradiol ring-cleavage dioxygenase [Streptomyces lincolnensis]AXG55441.1 intradiol ring-cleavage dioxygenase [Streptomyces lincolnensis]QMV08056.1 intradiol ring-cleavage dioxygenase [Streptomyces lincolnensis]
MHGHHGDEVHEHDRGLSYDLPVLARRRMIRLMAGASLVPLVGCSSEDGTAASAPSSQASPGDASSPATDASVECAPIPEETEGPFPGDGSNGVNVLKESGVVRSDVTRSFGDSAGGTAEGVPLTITLTVVDAASGCGTPKKGAAVYIWQCDREGRYSLYNDGVTDENYLRGVQEADDQGRVTFKSIFPGCYPGRWPHVHFEVFGSLADATAARSITNTSQLALPQDVSETVYATDGYGESVRNLGELSLESDMVFRDGHDQQLATVTGSTGRGYTASLTVPV